MQAYPIVFLITALLCLGSTAAFALTCPAPVLKEKSLVIRHPRVVDDPVRTRWTGSTTTADGAWSFGRLVTNLAGTHDPADFVQHWLEQWAADRMMNSFTVAARPSIQSEVLDHWPKRADGKLDLTKAPLRLLAIVYRPDLRDLAQGKAGQGRFVFSLLTASSDQFTVILEYNLPARTEREVKNWAEAFQRLSTLPFGNTFNVELEKITNRFTRKNAVPHQVNGSALSQVRTNEIALDSPWELREFKLYTDTKLLQVVTVKQTPDRSFNNTATLANWVDTNAAAIVGLPDQTSIEVPRSFAGRPFRAGAIANQDSGGMWNSPATNRQAMFRVAFNTCNGCHGPETNTSFLHISPRAPGRAASLSAFLLGATATGTPSTTPIAIADPRDGTPVRHFNELEFRATDLAALLCPTTPWRTGRATLEALDPLGRAVTGEMHRGPSVGLAH